MLKRILTRSLSLLLIFLTAEAYAVAPGFYLGLAMGPANNNGSNQQAQRLSPSTETVTATPLSQQFGTRVFMGYKMNDNFGTEWGFTLFSGIKYDTKDVQTCSSAKTRVRDLEFVGKGSYPMTWAEPFVKAGVALAYQTSSGTFNPDLSADCGKTTVSTKFVPTVGVGVGYDLNQNWVIDASWTRLMTSGAAGAMDFYGIGISYHIVDIYCGQFLCN